MCVSNSKKVLLITRYFPPLDSIATIRMFSWAKYLTRHGWQVSVLTTEKHKQSVIPLDLDITPFEVAEIPYFDPITFLGFNKKNLEKNETSGSNGKFFSKLKNRIVRFYQERMNERMPGRTDPWIFPAINELKRRRNKGIFYDYVISSYGPPSAHLVGFYAKKHLGAKWVADYRDLWLENHIYQGVWPFTYLERLLERSYVRHADMITTVSEPLQEILKSKFSEIPIHVIENGFDPELMDTAKDDYFDHEKKKFRIVYTGSLYRNQSDPTPFFQALKELYEEKKISEDTLEVLFFGSSIGNLKELILSHQLSKIVFYCGSVSLANAYRVQKSSDLLLFLSSPDPKNDGVLTGKLFEYLYVDVPILGIGIRQQSQPGKLITQTGSGIIFESDVASIKKSLLDLIKGNYEMKKNHQMIMNFTREKQVERLVSLISSLHQHNV